MAFEVKMTEDQIVDGLRGSYGTEFTAADIRGFCAVNDISYQTVTKKLKKYNVSKGKWNLEVTVQAVEKIEKELLKKQTLEKNTNQQLIDIEKQILNRISDICIFEPNISITKNCIIPISIVERYEQKYPGKIKSCNIMNSKKLMTIIRH